MGLTELRTKNNDLESLERKVHSNSQKCDQNLNQVFHILMLIF